MGDLFLTLWFVTLVVSKARIATTEGVGFSAVTSRTKYSWILTHVIYHVWIVICLQVQVRLVCPSSYSGNM